LEKVQDEGKSKARRERLFAAGKVEGIAEDTKWGRTLGLEEGLKRGKELVEHENTSFRATNKALHKRLCDTLEQSNGVATGNLIATQTAAQFAVEIQQYKNQVEFMERNVANQKDELETLKQLAGEQATELHTLRRASSSYVDTTSLSALRHGSSPYLNKPK
jgi:hypothetical protein